MLEHTRNRLADLEDSTRRWRDSGSTEQLVAVLQNSDHKPAHQESMDEGTIELF